MKNKGYTLIELLGVIVILAVLITLVFPSVINFIKKGNDKVDSITNDLIISATESYIKDNSSELYLKNGDEHCVSINTLIDEKYLTDDIKDTASDVKGIKVTYTDKYNYEITDSDTCRILAPGLYDEQDTLLATWDELIEKGLDIENDFTYSTSPNKNILDMYGNKYKLVVDDSITKIGNYGLYGCNKLIEIILPASVTSIGVNAFCSNSSLTSITLPNSIVSIGTYAFQNCSELTRIILPYSVTNVAPSSFSGCKKLESIVVAENNSVYDSRDNSNAIIETSSNTLIVGCKNTVIPNSVTSIGVNAFSNGGLTSITIPESVTSIGNYAFSDNFYLTSITIPNSVTSIGYGILGGCRKLESIVVAENNSVYDSRDNSNAIIETSSNTLIAGCKNTVIPNSVTSIGNYGFYNLTSLTSISIPNNVISFGDYSFSSTSLTSIELPEKLTSIGANAFSYNSKLTSITIPNSVVRIGDHAFTGCTKLESIYYKGTATGSPWGAPNATVVSE